MQRLLLAVGLGLLSMGRADEGGLVVAAQPAQLLGRWHISRWAGSIPFPRAKLRTPLPPFHFVINPVGKLEFRMHILKPSGCQLFKLPLAATSEPAGFVGWWKHVIYMWLVTPRSCGIAYFADTMGGRKVQMTMLFSRARREHPEALKIFEVFVERKGLNTTDIIHPPHLDACEPDAAS